jgi:glycosyltransferase involved in cell wall biosynthesis
VDVQDAEYQRLIDETDLFVFPFRTVSQSITFSAVAARGVPVVVSDVGGVSEVVRQYDAGRTFAPGDAAGLAARVVSLLTRLDEYEACREGVRRYAGAASWPAVARTHMTQYERVAP